MAGETEIASLGIVLDATQLDALPPKLKAATVAGDGLEKQTAKLTQSTKALATAESEWAKVTGPKGGALATQAAGIGSVASASVNAAKATDMLSASENRATATGEALHKTLQQGIADATGLSGGVKSAAASYAVFGQTLEGVSAIAAASTGATVNLTKSHAALSTQAMALGHSIRGSTEMLLQGVSPTRILAMEMNNLTYAASGPGGLKGAFASLMEGGLGVIIRFIAMAAPVLAVIGFFGALEYAAMKSAAANDKLQNTLSGIGRMSGVTMGQVTAATNAGATAANVSISTAHEWAETFATSGKIAGDVLIGLTENTKKYADATGTDTSDAVKALGSAFADPTKGAETLQAQLGLLTYEQLTHIKQLQAEGDLLGAQKVLYDQLNKTLDNTAQIHVTGLAAAWDNVLKSASNAWHAMVVAAGGGTALENLASAQLALQAAKSGQIVDAQPIEYYTKKVTEAQKAVDDLATSDAKATAGAKSRNNVIAGATLASTLVPETAAINELTSKLAVLKQAEDSAAAAGASPATVKNLASAYDIVKDTLGRVTDAYAKYGDQAGVDHAIAQLQAQDAATTDKAKKGQLQTQITMLKSLGDLATNEDVLTKARDAGLIVSGKVDNSNKGKIDSAEKQLTETQNLADATSKLNDQIRSGAITIAEANEQTKLDGELKSIVAERDNATGALKQKLTDIIAKLIPAYKELNAAQGDNALLSALDSQTDQLDYLQKQLDLVGANNMARATELALMKAKQDLGSGKMGAFDENNPTQDQQKYLDNAEKIAAATVNLTNKTDAYNASLTFTKDLISELASGATDAASGLASAFGNVGKAISGMTGALTKHTVAQATFVVRQAEIDKMEKGSLGQKQAQILLTTKQTGAEQEFYSGTLDAAKNMFDEKSAGYKILNTIEGAYNAMRLAGNIAIMASDLTASGVETATTGVSVANAATQSTAWGVTAIAKAIASMPFPFDLMAGAAVAAVLVGFGVSVAGGGGGSASAPAVDIAKDRQAAQGAGSVLGDASAKSDSIAKSLDQLSKDTNHDLEYSNQMVISLKAIQSGIGNLTGLLAQQLGVGGLFNTSSLGLGTNGGGGGILGSLFGSSKTTTTLLDQGIQIAASTIGQAVAGGLQANSYQTVQSVKSSSALFGLISSSKTTNNTTNSALPSDFTDQITGIVSSLRGVVLDAATKLGIDGAKEVVDSLSVGLNLSVKDMSGSDIQTALNAVFSKLGDDMASAAVPQLAKLQQVGEGALETLARVVNEYIIVDDAMKSMGKTFGAVGIDSIAARDALVQISGGLDQFTSQAQFFVDNFISSAAALVPIQSAVTDEMNRLGVAGTVTKDQFASLVQGIDVSTDSGQALYAALMNVAPAFAKVANAAAELNSQRLGMQITLLQDQGKAIEATALKREQELAALDASLRPLQEQIYATEDAAQAATDLADAQTQAAATAATLAKSRASMEITLMTDTGDAAGALALKRQQELAALDPSLVALQESIYAAEDAATATTALTKANINLAAAQKNLDALLNPAVNTAQDLANAHNDLTAAYQAESSALQSTIDKFSGFATSLNAFAASLAPGTTQSNSLAATRAAFLQTGNAAQAGDATALSNLQSVGQAFIDASATGSKTSIENATNIALVKSVVTASAAAAQGIANTATNQLGALNATVDGLNVINKSVLSVVAAISNLTLAQSADNATKATAIDAARQAVATAYDVVPGHATGLSYVPYDNYLMRAHEGETVLNRRDASEYRKGKNGGGSSDDKIDRLRREVVASNKRTADNTERLYDLIKRFTRDGQTLKVDTTPG